VNSGRFDAFLSYARKDAARIQPLRDAMDRAGIRYWIDTSQIQGGDEWENSIREALRRSDVLAVFVTEN
jgi:hypothetical protein